MTRYKPTNIVRIDTDLANGALTAQGDTHPATPGEIVYVDDRGRVIGAYLADGVPTHHALDLARATRATDIWLVDWSDDAAKIVREYYA